MVQEVYVETLKSMINSSELHSVSVKQFESSLSLYFIMEQELRNCYVVQSLQDCLPVQKLFHQD